ncbi:hypothetical protein GYMLUDRAFT_249813 [Collybiopsis luxurians FD-317 M1]|uniref:Unplaced genomic scaffold GYMLUscaffold_72, whole genome shotgun sequence n=1 Tax=Collybiopsis luxurians FD-317 M1 TaxID=944289 RepID=A0A0D0C803_9AGAR|nr:hypothetical protein GYMLUDRAFT_249813 [Collybiopsis luxurians FD-317 M1]
MTLTLNSAQQAIIDCVVSHHSSNNDVQLLLIVTGALRTGKTEVLQSIYTHFQSASMMHVVFKGAPSTQAAGLISGYPITSSAASLRAIHSKTLFLIDEAVSLESYLIVSMSDSLQKTALPFQKTLFFGGTDVVLFLDIFGYSDAHYPLWLPCIDDSHPILFNFTSHMHLPDCVTPFDNHWLHFTLSMQPLPNCPISVPDMSVMLSHDFVHLLWSSEPGLKIITSSTIDTRKWNKIAADKFAASSASVLYHSYLIDRCVNLKLNCLNVHELGTVLDFMSMAGRVTNCIPVCVRMPVTIVGGSNNQLWGEL